MLFWLLLAIDVFAALVAAYFFLVGLADGSISSFNIREWMVLLLAITAIIGGGFGLRRASYVKSANMVLAVLATPALLYVAFIAIVILSGERWN
jgi:hypothetical protein